MDFFIYSVFFISVFAPIYTYLLYPLILMIFPTIKYEIDCAYRPMVSIIIAAYNEESVIAEKIKNLISLDYPEDKIEFLVGSDGSNDRTINILNEFTFLKNLKVFDLPRGGKVNVLNYLLNKANGEIIVFSDANTFLKKNAVLELVKNFKDNRIGCVSGQLRYKVDSMSGQGAKSENTYWKYENWVKVQESKIGSLSGANGAIYAIRRKLLKQIPNGIINDDFYTATYIMQNGFDVVMDTEAIAYEVPNDDFISQFKRHVRDGSGHYQALVVFWRMIFPRKGAFVYISHRVIKWLVPFFLISAFITNGILAYSSGLMQNIFLMHVCGYLIVFANQILKTKLAFKEGLISKGLSIIFYFLTVNFALLLGFFRCLLQQQEATWETQR